MSDKKTIEVLSEAGSTFPPKSEFSEKAHIKSSKEYEKLYAESVDNPEAFWAREAEIIEWTKKWEKVSEWDFDKPEVKWYLGATLNASYNCLDRHIKERGSKAAIIWEADDGSKKTFTYSELLLEVSRFANVLKKKGIKKGDRITIYLPMIPELAIAMLASARIGAIHSVVFGGFSSSSLAGRINDSGSTMLITADEGVRGGKPIQLKKNADIALLDTPTIKDVIVVKRTGKEVPMNSGRDTYLDDELGADDIKDICEPTSMDSEAPLFILYTSGSTGKPKGVLHTTGGYMVFSALTFKWVFDYREEDIYFCTADIGWITGHTYIVYGPLALGGTTLLFEGVPTYPDSGRFWDIIDKHKVSIFYTAPTAIRALMGCGDDWVDKYDLKSLRLLGSVGEPINPEAWKWYFEKIGNGKLPLVDTWWQTETGGILISPLPGVNTLKPGSASRPLPGILAKILREDGTEAGVNEGGYLVIERPWPGMLRGTYGDSENKHMKELYFSRFPGVYTAGDSARKDEDGDYWLMGRIDDVLNVSGHRIGTAEVESALVSHRTVSEAAVVGFPHAVKGEGVYAFVTVNEDVKPSEELRRELEAHVREVIGPIAKPDKLHFATALPKTRSGKIMRRILRKIAEGNVSEADLGDTSTLADPSVVAGLVKDRL